eukprot:GHVR01143891.1.p1 GENE.GHVR01143891.1~~GHVR01143891.1.p1  ORF type:complete len:138 (-),score=6.50 GHVR01143891.1:348-761(-)
MSCCRGCNTLSCLREEEERQNLTNALQPCAEATQQNEADYFLSEESSTSPARNQYTSGSTSCLDECASSWKKMNYVQQRAMQAKIEDVVSKFCSEYMNGKLVTKLGRNGRLIQRLCQLDNMLSVGTVCQTVVQICFI